jgi:hypothetical protein
MPDQAGVPRDRDARPSLDHVLALRTDRVTTMRQVLAGRTEPVRSRIPGAGELRSAALPSGHAPARNGNTGTTTNGNLDVIESCQ